MPENEPRKRYYTPGPPPKRAGSPPQNMFQKWAQSPSIIIEEHEHEKWESRGIPSPYKDPGGFNKATRSGLSATAGGNREHARQLEQEMYQRKLKQDHEEAARNAPPPGWVGRNEHWLTPLVYALLVGGVVWAGLTA